MATEYKKYRWIKIEDTYLEAMADNSLYPLEIEGKKVCLVKYQGQYFAIQNTCPHAGGSLGRGWLDGKGNVVCPLHRYKFDLKSGRNTSGEGYYIKTYPVEQKQDGWYIGLPMGKFLGLF